MVSCNSSIHMFIILSNTWINWNDRRGSVFSELASNDSFICNSNQTKKDDMNKGVIFIGGIIFAVYIYLTFWNIFYSHKKQREENYPNLTKKKITDLYLNENKDEIQE